MEMAPGSASKACKAFSRRRSSKSCLKLVPSEVNMRWSERALIPEALARRAIGTAGSSIIAFRTSWAEWLNDELPLSNAHRSAGASSMSEPPTRKVVSSTSSSRSTARVASFEISRGAPKTGRRCSIPNTGCARIRILRGVARPWSVAAYSPHIREAVNCCVRCIVSASRSSDHPACTQSPPGIG